MPGILQRLRRTKPDPRLGELKLRAIDAACQRARVRTLADLGAVWAVDAGYSLYAHDRHRLERTVICDDRFTEPVLERARDDPEIELVQGNFGTAEVAERVGSVDAVLMFDVLLHQVDPDWDDVLGLYASRASCLVLAGPWWNGPETVRLLHLGHEEYLRSVPLPDFHAEALDKLDEIHPERGRPWRDAHDIWQWGITDRDLRARMEVLGFRLVHFENVGPWAGLERFDDCSYVFVRAAG